MGPNTAVTWNFRCTWHTTKRSGRVSIEFATGPLKLEFFSKQYCGDDDEQILSHRTHQLLYGLREKGIISGFFSSWKCTCGNECWSRILPVINKFNRNVLGDVINNVIYFVMMTLEELHTNYIFSILSDYG